MSKRVAVLMAMVLLLTATSSYMLGVGRGRVVARIEMIELLDAKSRSIGGNLGTSSDPSNRVPANEQQAFSPEERTLIANAQRAYAEFREGSDGDERSHTEALAALMKRNVCWGKIGQSQAEYEYHRCTDASLQKQPAPSAGSDAAKCNAGDHDACMRL